MELSILTHAQLLALHVGVLQEFELRHITRTMNNLTGDYAEYLVARALSLHLEPKNMLGYDATDTKIKHGRYQIKGRRITANDKQRQLGKLPNLHQQPFDFLAGVLFALDYTVLRACVLPYEAVWEVARRKGETTDWLLFLQDRLWLRDDVTDITEKVRAAASVTKS